MRKIGSYSRALSAKLIAQLKTQTDSTVTVRGLADAHAVLCLGSYLSVTCSQSNPNVL